MKVINNSDNIEFIPENDLDVFNLGQINFKDYNCEFSKENKMIKLSTTIDSLLTKLFENKDNLYKSY